MKYYDKNGEEIKAGMTIKHDEGDIDKVYYATDEDGEYILGINASNEEFLKNNPSWEREIHPLSEFNMSEWEIVKE